MVTLNTAPIQEGHIPLHRRYLSKTKAQPNHTSTPSALHKEKTALASSHGIRLRVENNPEQRHETTSKGWTVPRRGVRSTGTVALTKTMRWDSSRGRGERRTRLPKRQRGPPRWLARFGSVRVAAARGRSGLRHSPGRSCRAERVRAGEACTPRHFVCVFCGATSVCSMVMFWTDLLSSQEGRREGASLTIQWSHNDLQESHSFVLMKRHLNYQTTKYWEICCWANAH